MSHLGPQDDLIHATGEESNWREAFYFDFIDPDSGFTGFGYSGVHPNQQTGDVIFALWKRDVLLARFTCWDFNIPRDIGIERLDFGPLCFRPVTPFKSWEMMYDDGHCRLNLAFEAIHPAYSWADSEAALARTDSHHYEQQGRYAGTVRVGHERYPVAAVGVRDHAWGWGARARITRWIWASAQFGPAFAFNGFQISLEDGRDVHYGYIWRGSHNDFLQRSRMSARYGSMGQAPAGFSVELEGRSGDRVCAEASVLNAFNVSHQERNKQGYHYFCATEYDADGSKGFGHANLHWRNKASRPGEWTVQRS